MLERRQEYPTAPLRTPRGSDAFCTPPSSAGDSRRQCLGGCKDRKGAQIPVPQCSEGVEGAESLVVRTVGSSAGAERAPCHLPRCRSSKGRSGVCAKEVQGGNILPCTSNCHATQYGNLCCRFVFETKAGIGVKSEGLPCRPFSTCWCTGVENWGRAMAPGLGPFPGTCAQPV